MGIPHRHFSIFTFLCIFTFRTLGVETPRQGAMEEEGAQFLPCCYGYATTIRRAQGASLDLGCIYFDQRRHHAGRGYGYVGVSRFKTRAGCFLYGKLRQTDFLPVGEETTEEVLERGVESETSDEEEMGMEHAFQGGESDIFDVSDNWDHANLQGMSDDFGSTPGLAELGPLYDSEITRAEPELHDVFN